MMWARTIGSAAALVLVGCGGTTGATPAATPNTTSTEDRTAQAAAPPAPKQVAPKALPRGSAKLPDGRYRVVLDRHQQVGDKRRLEAQAREVAESTFFEGGRRVQHNIDVKAIRFEGQCLTRAVNTLGNAIAVSCEANVLDDQRRGARLLSSGARVVIERRPNRADTKVTVDGTPASIEVRDALDLVLGLTENDESDDDVFGSPEPVSVGDSWPIDGDALGRQLETALHMKPVEPPTGKIELVAVTDFEGIPTMHFRARIDATEMTADDGNARFTSTMENKLPVDLAGSSVWAYQAGELQTRRELPENPGVTLDFKLQRTVEVTILPID
jgi:hypothetical protein